MIIIKKISRIRISDEEMRRNAKTYLKSASSSISRWPEVYRNEKRRALLIDHDAMLEIPFPPRSAPYRKMPFEIVVDPVMIMGFLRFLIDYGKGRSEWESLIREFDSFEAEVKSYLIEKEKPEDHVIISRELLRYLPPIISKYHEAIIISKRMAWDPMYDPMPWTMFMDIINYNRELGLIWRNQRFSYIIQEELNEDTKAKFENLLSWGRRSGAILSLDDFLIDQLMKEMKK